MRGKGIALLYDTGGPNLVAYRLTRLFTRIETEEDRVLHNDVLAEVMDIINTGGPEKGKLTSDENVFIRGIVELMYKGVDRKKRFLFRVAELILRLGRKK